MLKTRAYLCQAVIDGSPMSHVASAIYGQARQTVEGLFRRAKGFKGWSTRKSPPHEAPPILHQSGAKSVSRGLVATFHKHGQGMISRYLERNHQSLLVNAMRSRYALREGEYRGLAKRLSAFAFVGVGVASRAQWNSDADRLQFDPVCENIKDMVGVGAVKAVEDSFGQMETLAVRTAVENEHCHLEPAFHVVVELELSFDFLDNPAFSDAASSTSEDSDITLVSDDEDSVEMEFQDVQPVVVIGEAGSSLMRELDVALSTVNEQRVALNALRQTMLQLNSALQQFVGPSAPVELCEPFEVLDVPDTVAEQSGQGLTSMLSLAAHQKIELTVLHKMVAQQRKKLTELISQRDVSKPFELRSAFCKRDACCGPGTNPDE